MKFIKDIRSENDLPAVVSFSGGKDSLACLLLTRDAGLELPVFFIDTGLEFPETVTYVHEVAKHYDLDLIVEHAPENAFFGNLAYFGPPGRDYPLVLQDQQARADGQGDHASISPNGVLSFIGQRRYESEQRADKPRVWRNPWTPGQVGASPIQNWTALHVWIYIFMREGAVTTPGTTRDWTASAASSARRRTWPSWNWSRRVGRLQGRWDAYLQEYAEIERPAQGMGRPRAVAMEALARPRSRRSWYATA